MPTPSTDKESRGTPLSTALHVWEHRDYYEMMGTTVRVEPGLRRKSKGADAIRLDHELIGDITRVEGMLGPQADAVPNVFEVELGVVGTPYVVGVDASNEAVSIESHRTNTPKTHVHVVDELEVGFDE